MDPSSRVMEITKINKWNKFKQFKQLDFLIFFLHSKGNHKQNENTTYRMGENICKQCNWQGINLQNIQTAHAAQYQSKHINKQTPQ